MSNSAFNMSKCGSRGGTGSSCSSSGWAEIKSTGGDDITVVSSDKLRQALREIYLADKQDHINQVADIVKLVYDCPKEGDAVFYNSRKSGYDLASAEIDNSNYFKDPEHLIESLAIVEKVSVSCQDGQDVPSDGYTAKVVFFGKITFSEDTTDLDPGMVYYLADSYAKINAESGKFIGSNAVHSMYEPTISKPLFVATGPHTAIVTNYRPLTGSPTGGREISEEYRMRIDPTIYNDSNGDFLSTGWKIRIDNTGTVTSRNHLLLQIEYNKLEGPQEDSNIEMIGTETYVHHIDIGVLHNEAEANIRDDDEVVSFKEIDFKKGTTPYVTGIGEIKVRLKVITQSTANLNFNDKLNAPEVLLANADDITTSRIVPKLSWTNDCKDDLSNDNDIFVKGNQKQSNVTYDEGAVFIVSLVGSSIPIVGSTEPPKTIIVPMQGEIGFKIEALESNLQGEENVDPLFEPITNSFSLDNDDKQMIEIIPVSSEGSTIVEKTLRISAINTDGTELPKTHWAYEYSIENLTGNKRFCPSSTCCVDSLESFNPMDVTSNSKNISDLFTSDGDSLLINNPSNAKFYTKGMFDVAYTGIKNNSGNPMAITWKNCRENTVFCYPPTNEGLSPAFMTIYADEARPLTPSQLLEHTKEEYEAKLYDPRYTIMEIGAHETLNGKLVRLTVNAGSTVSGANETCYFFKYNGSEHGTHFTISELRQLDNNFTERFI